MDKDFISLLWAIGEVVDITDWEIQDIANLLNKTEDQVFEIFNEAAELFHDLEE